MTTLAQLADLIQIQLSDTAAGTWSQATVEGWVLEAIRDYSIHFPRNREQSISCTDGTHKYALASDFIDAVRVEYPEGEDPPQYLTRLSHTHPDFWLSDDCYDIYSGLPHTDLAALAPRGYIIISASPSTGEDILLTYTTHHKDDLASGDAVTVPNHHFDLIGRFVIWRAWVERLADEEAAPNQTVLLLSQLASNADRAHRAYTEALNRAKAAGSDSAPTGPWRSDIYDPIY